MSSEERDHERTQDYIILEKTKRKLYTDYDTTKELFDHCNIKFVNEDWHIRYTEKFQELKEQQGAKRNNAVRVTYLDSNGNQVMTRCLGDLHKCGPNKSIEEKQTTKERVIKEKKISYAQGNCNY